VISDFLQKGLFELLRAFRTFEKSSSKGVRGLHPLKSPTKKGVTPPLSEK